MKLGCKGLALATALVAVLAFGVAANAAGPNKCSSGKTKLAGKKAAALLKCYSKASGKGVAIDANCVTKAKTKFALGSQKIDAKQSFAPGKEATVCPAGAGDEVARENDVDAHVDDVANDLDPGLPGTPTAASKCTAGKLKCAGKKDAGILTCQAKALGKGIAVDSNCITKVEGKFSACYAALESKEIPPQAPPTNVCVAPDGDATSIENKITTFTAAIVVAYLGGSPLCPTTYQFTAASSGTDEDLGWVGFAHDESFPSNARFTLAIGGCANPTAPCGTCNLSGPINNAGAFANHRCTGDAASGASGSWVPCTSNADCPGVGNSCEFFLGPPQPAGIGGIGVCFTNTLVGSVSGTVDPTSGSSAFGVSLHNNLYLGPVEYQPCPQCVAGSCDRGERLGMACSIGGTDPFEGESLSLDCPPLHGTLLASLSSGSPISLSTGAQTVTLSAASPDCHATGFTTNKCFCDTCNNAATTACSTNADCPVSGGNPGICGGRRCLGGTNAGAPCSLNSECPGVGTSCGVPGQATQPNQCSDAVCTPNTPPDNDSSNEGMCAADLPGDQFCNIDRFRGCFVDADCPITGDTCAVTATPRECFTDNGGIGGSVSVSGVASVTAPTLGALFCLPPTAAVSANGVIGLPGLGRLTLPGTAVIN